jgi:hypothetical protein
MNTPSFYEQVGIIIPGAVLLFGLMQLLPESGKFIGTDAATLGEFGIFFLLSYAAGHLVAALANVGERAVWHFAGGMPTDWVVKEATGLISSVQRDRLDAQIQSRLGMSVVVKGLERKQWFPISRQLYAEVMRNGKPDRIETFNGNYGLNRGLAAACVVLMCIAALKTNLIVAGVLALAALMFGYRAYRFGVHYARELYVQFLAIEDGK